MTASLHGRPRHSSSRPLVCGGVDDFAWTFHVFRLEARCGIGDAAAVREDEAIARTGAGLIGYKFVVTVGVALHRKRVGETLDLQLHGGGSRGPDGEPDAAVGLQFRARWQLMVPGDFPGLLVLTSRARFLAPAVQAYLSPFRMHSFRSV